MSNIDLDSHWNRIYLHQQKDFRSANLNKMMLKLIPKDGFVLDVGSGTCAQTLTLLKHGYSVYAIDSSTNMVRNGREILKKAGVSPEIVQLKDLYDLSEKEQFDIVICLDVLEHLEDDYKAFRCLCNSLKANGTILVSVPAIKSLYSQKDIELGHHRRYDRERLIPLFNSCNIEIERIRYWAFIGILPVFLSIKKNTRVKESFRYKRSLLSRLINKTLFYWFLCIENNIDIGIGLTLFCVGRKV